MNLRPIHSNDLATVQEWASQGHLSEYFRRYPPTLDWNSPEAFMRAMGIAFLCEDCEVPVGMIQLSVDDPKAKVVNMGMLVDKRRTKVKEVSFEMCVKVCDYVFIESDFNKIAILILAHREKLATRVQDYPWKQEGVLRENCYWRGQYHDEIKLGLLKSEYLEWKSSR